MKDPGRIATLRRLGLPAERIATSSTAHDQSTLELSETMDCESDNVSDMTLSDYQENQAANVEKTRTPPQATPFVAPIPTFIDEIPSVISESDSRPLRHYPRDDVGKSGLGEGERLIYQAVARFESNVSKLLLLITGSASVAVLLTVGVAFSISESGNGATADFTALVPSFEHFVVGLSIATFAAGLGYAAELVFINLSKLRNARRFINLVQWLGIGLVLLAFMEFILGAFAVSNGLGALAANQTVSVSAPIQGPSISGQSVTK